MASKAFSAPHLLFLNTWDGPERDYVSGLFRRMKAAGYERFVEPCAGSFVIPSVAVECGWPPAVMESSDIALFSTAVGYVFSGQDVRTLDVRIDGEPVEILGDTPTRQAASVLYWQLVARTAAKPDVPYWNALRRDLEERRPQHVTDIEKNIIRLEQRLRGMRYRCVDLWRHLADVADDPKTIVSCNPPSYKCGFEKFFSTKGRLTWNQPTYEVFDPAVDIARILQTMADKAALILVQQQAAPGGSAGPPVYARHLSPGQYIYLMTNRSDEVLRAMGGLKVTPYKATPAAKIKAPMIPQEYVIRPDSRIEAIQVKDNEAQYYRDLWMHRISFTKAGTYVGFLVDGYLAGLVGYDLGPLIRPYPGTRASGKYSGCLLLTFAVAAPHQQRLTRLMTMLALTDRALKRALVPRVRAMVTSLITAELTKYPEAKGLRGLMKLLDRRKDKRYGFRLVYQAPVRMDDWPVVLEDYLARETRWQTQRQATARP